MTEDTSDPFPPAINDGAALRVISNLYDAVADGGDYEPMFFAMDEVIDQVLGAPEIERGAEALDPLLRPHFDRAAHVFDIMSRQEAETPLTFVDRSTNPVAVLDFTGKIIAANGTFEMSFAEPGATLDGQFAAPGDQQRFTALTRSNAPDGQVIINAVNPDDGTPLSLLVGMAPQIKMPHEGTSALYAMMIKPMWGAKTADLLRDAYHLNTAEIEILKSFVQTGSVQGVAEERNRSIRTVRTQLSRIFAQMGITGQTGLALFLATLGGLVSDTEEDRPSTPAAPNDKAAIQSHDLTFRGKTIEYYDYGHPKGTPILLIQSSHPPELFDALRVQLYDANLRIIAPMKPGSGRSEHLPNRPGPEDLAKHYKAVLDAAGFNKAIIAGQASGGLYALELAKQFPRAASAVCLIDTGVPFRDRSELMALPKTIRRTMVPARYFPDLLYLPHRLVASNFRRSRKGEAQVVDYFFMGSPIELQLTRTRREAYEFTRALIAYSFDDTDRLVQDVSRWASDWSGLLDEVASQTHVHFVHGADNMFFRADRIEEWVAKHPTSALTALPAGGQLACLEHPEVLTECLASLAAKIGSKR